MNYSKYSVVLEYLGVFGFCNRFEALEVVVNGESTTLSIWSLN